MATRRRGNLSFNRVEQIPARHLDRADTGCQ
jgi:hypothetical protein